MTTRPILLAALCIGLPLSSNAASFDCAKAETTSERTICADDRLSNLDEQLAKAYRSALAAVNGSDSARGKQLRVEQRIWLKRRNQCQDSACLLEVYDERLRVLTATRAHDVPVAKLPISERKITDSGPHFSLAATYPVFQDAGMERINQTIHNFVLTLTEPFVRENQTVAADEEVPADMPSSSLDIDYDAPFSTDRYILIAFTGDDFRTGAAHGMPVIEPLIIDRRDGRQIQPNGLFRPGAPWMKRLAAMCRKNLARRDEVRSDPDGLRAGTEPKAENYRLLYPGPEGLTVTFPPYAVASYAAGPQDVLIPYAALSDILNPDLFRP
jgi:uncharacterized protein